VLPKLKEERERSRKKSTKKRAIKDVVKEGTYGVWLEGKWTKSERKKS
jgi:hypothetical protein